MSTHECPVVRVRLEPHPNADRLAVAAVGGYRCVVKKDDFSDGDLAVYIPPDYCVDTKHPAFQFLGSKSRITIRRFRGVVSDGLMLPVSAFPEHSFAEGDNALLALGIERWEPKTEGPKVGNYDGAPAPAVPLATVKFDLEALKGFPDAIKDTDYVFVTEKIHGSNWRCCITNDGVLHVGSHTRWLKRPSEGEPVPAHWACLTPEFETFLRSWCAEGYVYYGEVYGASVHGAKFAYDAAPGTVRCRLFTLQRDIGRSWLWQSFPQFFVPLIVSGIWSEERGKVEAFVASGKSRLADGQVAEGVVVHDYDLHGCDLPRGMSQPGLKLICPAYYEATS